MKTKNDNPRLVQRRLFECSECGTRNIYTKRKNKTSKGHVKTAYCYKCRKVTDQIQIE